MTMLDTFIEQYLATALWSTNDDSTPQGGEPLDRNYDSTDIAPETLSEMRSDCKAFFDANYDDIADDVSQAGHDFWLTRNGHVAGFWDGGWPEPAATRLTNASKLAGEVNLTVGDDGLIYC